MLLSHDKTGVRLISLQRLFKKEGSNKKRNYEKIIKGNFY